MAKINVSFDNTNYSIDESSLFSATNNLKSHLSSVMSGTGATIELGGTSYDIDSAKLSAAMNAFVSHLGTVAGNGFKVVVNGVEYNVDSAKMAGAVAELHAVLGGLQSGDEGDDDNGGYDDTFPVSWNTLDVVGNPTIEYDSMPYVKISALTPAPDVLNTLAVNYNGKTLLYSDAVAPNIDGVVAGARYAFSSIVDGVQNNEYYIVYVVYQAGNYGGFILPETGIYVLDAGSFGVDCDFVLDDSDQTVLRHDDEIAEGAYYGNLVAGTFYDEMPETVSDGDMYVYGDYVYQYKSEVSGWYVSLATVEAGILNFIPTYPVVDRNNDSYGAILASINGVPVVSLGHSNLNGTFTDCVNITSVGRIGSGASVEIPDSITVWNSAFLRCSSLNTVNCPYGVSDIYSTFSGCNELAMVIIPNNVTSIDFYAFASCENLTSIEIPSGVTNIGQYAFAYTGLSSITYGSTTAQWEAIDKHLSSWNLGCGKITVTCTNGTVVVPAYES